MLVHLLHLVGLKFVDLDDDYHASIHHVHPPKMIQESYMRKWKEIWILKTIMTIYIYILVYYKSNKVKSLFVNHWIILLLILRTEFCLFFVSICMFWVYCLDLAILLYFFLIRWIVASKRDAGREVYIILNSSDRYKCIPVLMLFRHLFCGSDVLHIEGLDCV